MQDATRSEILISPDRKKVYKRVLDEDVFSYILLHEAGILSLLNHPFIIPFSGVKIIKGRLYLEFPYVKESFAELVLDGKIKDPIDIAYQLASAVSYLHDLGIAHLDLKPANILIKEENNRQIVQLIDFDLSEFVLPIEGEKITYTFRPVENLLSIDKYYDLKSDIWSLGMIYYFLFTRRVLSTHEEETYGTSINFILGNYDYSKQKFLLPDQRRKTLAKISNLKIKNLTDFMLHPEKKRRPSAKKILSYFFDGKVEMIKSECFLKECFEEDDQELSEEAKNLDLSKYFDGKENVLIRAFTKALYDKLKPFSKEDKNSLIEVCSFVGTCIFLLEGGNWIGKLSLDYLEKLELKTIKLLGEINFKIYRTPKFYKKACLVA